MANTNTLTQAIPQLLAQGLLALRQMAVMSRFVNRAYESEAGQLGSSIQVPVPSAITAAAVSPSYVAPDDSGVVPTSVNIALDQWYEAPFFLSDKDMLDAMNGTIPMQASEAVKALANNVDSAILARYVDVYGFAGTAGTTPFAADLQAFLDARKNLNNQLAPLDPRYVALNADAEANALALRAFQDASFRGDTQGIVDGMIGRKLGSTWFVDQLIPTHTAGTASGATTGTDAVIGVTTTFTLDSAGTGTLLAGDVIVFSTDPTHTYTVVTGDADVSNGGTLVVSPAAQASWTASATITVKANHVANLAFHRDAFALANRPFAGADPLGIGMFQSAVDPVSGLSLRLEVTRQHKRTRFAYDILYGVKTVRAALASRLAG